MKSGRLNLRISEKRLAKLKIYAGSKEKTVTQLVEDWIDRLPSQKIDDSLSNPLPKSF
jgi:predicted HicB family RNase H-like nuclease